MRVKDTRHSAKMSLFLGILLATCLFAAAAHADPLFKGKFKLANEVHWGQAVLPPGEYALTLDGWTQTIVIDDAKSGAAVGYSRADDNSELLVNVRGRQRVVYSLRLAGFGEVFQRARISTRERRAAEEARNAEAIPVQVAQK
jgi:hypothetical protein